ncbi:urease accessory protein UreF [Pelagibacterium montanilacus]|uniref:urease accessory protein UreF n=1 Tax=Pelagibacterium montanilacus TaxID=2185280 RepID=UPI000F8C9324|nr:urease accessory UreF family protein [Pelagibacterium montanilacus]
MGTTITIEPGQNGTRRLVRLLSWLSPAFPIGGFAYSQGLETAIATGTVTDRASLVAWIEGQMASGGLHTDASFVGISLRAAQAHDIATLAEANALALALQPSAERDKETREQARSFVTSAAAWPLDLGEDIARLLEGDMALPVAFGTLAGSSAIAGIDAVAGYLNAYAGQQIAVALRLVPLGQTEGLAALAGLEPGICALADTAAAARLETIGAIGYGTDIAAMRHEDLGTRIFRS